MRAMPLITSMDSLRPWLRLPGCALAAMLLGCSNAQDIVEPPPIAAVVTGRVIDAGGAGVSQATVTLRVDRVDAPAQVGLTTKDVVTASDGSFAATMLVGGWPEMEAVVHVIAAPPAASGLASDSAAASVRLKEFPTPEEAVDTVSVNVTLKEE